MIEPIMDLQLESLANKEGVSKGALIRRFVEEAMSDRLPKPLGPDDPIWKLAGAGPDLEPLESEDDIDRIVYGLDE